MAKGVISTVEGGKLLLTLAKEYYLREAVFATADKFSNRCSIQIFPVGEYEVGVCLSARGGSDENKLRGIADEFCEELIDQQVRLDLEKRNGKIRELIVRQAFSPLDNLEKEARKI